MLHCRFLYFLRHCSLVNFYHIDFLSPSNPLVSLPSYDKPVHTAQSGYRAYYHLEALHRDHRCKSHSKGLSQRRPNNRQKDLQGEREQSLNSQSKKFKAILLYIRDKEKNTFC